MTQVRQFQITIPASNLQQSHNFFKNIMKCKQIRTVQGQSIHYDFYSHRLSIYNFGQGFQPQQHCNHVDKYDVPVPHFGIVLSVQQFLELSNRLVQSQSVKFIIEPHIRFQGEIGEQHTMFFKDPSGNNLQFKAMTNPVNLFAK